MLHDSNRLVVRVTPCDTVARVTPMTHFGSAEHELEVARQLGQTGSPIVPLDARVEPRIVTSDGFKVTMWTYFEPVPQRAVPPPLDTEQGPLFIDFENAAYGPVEYDLAWVPAEVSERYPNADRSLVAECRGLVLAIIAMHRWRRDDQHPGGRKSGTAFLNAVRAGPPWPSLDTV